MIFKFEFQPMTSADMTTSTDTDIEKVQLKFSIFQEKLAAVVTHVLEPGSCLTSAQNV